MTKRIKLIIASIVLSAGTLLVMNYLFSTESFFLGAPVRTQIGIERKLFDKTEEEPDMSLIRYGGDPVPYDKNTNTIYLPVNINNDNWDKILTSDVGQIYFVKNAMLRKGDKKQIVAEGEALELYLVADKVFYRMNVILTGMPIVSINNWYDISKAHWGGSIEVFDPQSVGKAYQATTCDYYTRGNLSRIYPKSSYRLTLSEKKLSLCGLRKDDDWILNSLYDDLGFVRTRLAYTLWNEMSATNGVSGDDTVESAYVELIINNEYEGLYLLTDRIDAKKTGITDNDILYKQRTWPMTYNDEGYWDAFLISYPKDYGQDEIDLMTSFMSEVYEHTEHDTDYEQLSGMLYMDNAIDYELFCMYLTAGDNLFKNSYIAAIKQPDDTYKLMQIPWDTNGTFGILGGHVDFDEERIDEMDFHSLVGSALRDCDANAFHQSCAVRWEELRQNVFSEENVTELANEYIDYIEDTGAYKRNIERWPVFTRPDHEDFEDLDYTEMWKKDDLFRMILERGRILDDYYANPLEEQK